MSNYLISIPYSNRFITFYTKKVYVNYNVGALLSKSTSFSYRPWEVITLKSFNLMGVYLDDIIVEKLPSLSKIRVFNLQNAWITNDLRYTYEAFSAFHDIAVKYKLLKACLLRRQESKLHTLDTYKEVTSFTNFILYPLINKHYYKDINSFILNKLSDSANVELSVILKQQAVLFNSYNEGFINLNKHQHLEDFGTIIDYKKIFSSDNKEYIKKLEFSFIFTLGINLRLDLPEFFLTLLKLKLRCFSFFTNYIDSFDVLLSHKLNSLKIFHITNDTSEFTSILKGSNNNFRSLLNVENVFIFSKCFTLMDLKNMFLIVLRKFKNKSNLYSINLHSRLSSKFDEMQFNTFSKKMYKLNNSKSDYNLINIFDCLPRTMEYTYTDNSIFIYYVPEISSILGNDVISNNYTFSKFFIKSNYIYNNNGWFLSIDNKLKFFKGIFNKVVKDHYSAIALLICQMRNYSEATLTFYTYYNNRQNDYYKCDLLITLYNINKKNQNNFWLYVYTYRIILLYLNLNKNEFSFKIFLGLNNSFDVFFIKNYLNNLFNDELINTNKLKLKLNNILRGKIINKLQTTNYNFDEYNNLSINLNQRNSITMNLLYKLKSSNEINFQNN